MTVTIDAYYKQELEKLIKDGNYTADEIDLLERLNEYDGDRIDDAIFHNDGNGIIHEIADNCVDIYHADRFRWLASDFNNSDYIEDAINEYDYDFSKFNLSDVIALGQFKYYFDLLNELISNLSNEIEQYTDSN